MLCDTQGEAPQYPPTGGRLWDQKRVLPVPRTVSSAVRLAGDQSLPACVCARPACCADYTLVAWGLVDMRRALNSAHLAFGYDCLPAAPVSSLHVVFRNSMRGCRHAACATLAGSSEDAWFLGVGIQALVNFLIIFCGIIETISPLQRWQQLSNLVENVYFWNWLYPMNII